MSYEFTTSSLYIKMRVLHPIAIVEVRLFLWCETWSYLCILRNIEIEFS